MDGSSTPIRVGIIGLSATAGWAARAHLPALRALPGFEVWGLSASSPAAGQASGTAHQVPHVYPTAQALIDDDDIEVVVVAVKVTDHHPLILRALAAGKSVVSEWPLDVDLAQARELAEAADQAGVKTLVGLQSRSAPAILRLRELILAGTIGDVLSTSVHGGGGNWAGTFATRSAYQLDRNNGATMITISLAHTLDAVTAVLGPFAEVSATTATRRPHSRNLETGAIAAVTAEDQVALHGVLAGGAVASVHLRGGVPERNGFVWEIHGSTGDLTITQDWAHPQFGPLTIDGLPSAQIPAPLAADPALADVPGTTDDPAYNVGAAYRGFHTWLTGGPRTTPDFQDAVTHHELIDAIHRAARTGTKQKLGT